MNAEDPNSSVLAARNRRWVTADTPPTQSMKDFFCSGHPRGGHRKYNRKKIVSKKGKIGSLDKDTVNGEKKGSLENRFLRRETGTHTPFSRRLTSGSFLTGFSHPSVTRIIIGPVDLIVVEDSRLFSRRFPGDSQGVHVCLRSRGHRSAGRQEL